MDQVMIEIKNISKYFGAFAANDDISFEVRRGEVLTLLGENGAGKSTLMNILCGLYKPSSGHIFVDGKEVKIESPSDAGKLGIGMVHQHFMLVEALTVFQNIILGKSHDTAAFINKQKLKQEIVELSDRYGLNVELDEYITDISVGVQQRVEILKSLWRGAELLILDEPTAVLTDEETEGLFRIIRRLVAEGKSVIFISHKMKEVMQISDRILVLRRGRLVGSFLAGEASEQELANTMVGGQLVLSDYEKQKPGGSPLQEIRDVSYNAASKHSGLNHISLDIYPGEILGIAGVDGNGQAQLAQLAAGLIEPDSGTVTIKGASISLFDPYMFIVNGISHIPEDRNRMGLIGDMTIRENLIAKAGDKKYYSQKGLKQLNKKYIATYAQSMREKYDIRCTSTEQNVGSLSGGNQQKVILARELEQNPDLLIAAHPTRGLDIGATKFIHDCIIQARARGCAILFISTDLAEVLLMSDRIAVMYEGEIMGVFDGAQPPVEEISLAMAGKVLSPEGAGPENGQNAVSVEG